MHQNIKIIYALANHNTAELKKYNPREIIYQKYFISYNRSLHKLLKYIFFNVTEFKTIRDVDDNFTLDISFHYYDDTISIRRRKNNSFLLVYYNDELIFKSYEMDYIIHAVQLKHGLIETQQKLESEIKNAILRKQFDEKGE